MHLIIQNKQTIQNLLQWINEKNYKDSVILFTLVYKLKTKTLTYILECTFSYSQVLHVQLLWKTNNYS